ncbi:hypothetical protein [Treponema zioleckii]|uniref:hypothetical protein n=1 Tax=Treponema zioleckii TaxID=331680 RepID=UPI00168B2D37|nr:hypothetical protein [Treponema zioleckii]
MKLYAKIGIFSALFSILLFSCSDLTMPESISVKHKGSFAVPLGSGEFAIKDKMSAEKIQEILDENTSDSEASGLHSSVYDYNPTAEGANPDDNGDKVIQYALNYPIVQIPISLNSDSNLDEITFESSFSAPDLENTVQQNLTVTGETVRVFEPGDSEAPIEGVGLNFNITSPDFEEMTVRRGRFKITLAPNGTPSADFRMRATFTLKNAATGEVIAVSEPVEVGHGGDAYIDLAGRTIVQQMRITASGTILGGSVGTQRQYTASVGPESSLTLSKITGVTMTNDDLGTDGTININEQFPLTGLNNKLDHATIAQGTLNFNCQLPDGWTGVKLDEQNFTLGGGISIENNDFTDVQADGYIINKTASLAGKTVTPNPVTTNGSYIKISLENATIIFPENSDDLKISLNGKCNITELTEVEISLADIGNKSGSIDTGLNFSSMMSDFLSGDNSDLINNIQFKDIKGYLFINEPGIDALSSFTASGSVTANYSGTSKQFVPSNTNLPVKRTIKTLETLANENRMVTSEELFAEGNYSYEISSDTLCDVFNARPDNLTFDYNFSLSGTGSSLTISGEELNALSKGAAINVNIVLVVPLKIEITDTTDGVNDNFVTINDVLALMSEDAEITEDILKRDSAEDSEKWNEWADVLKSFQFNYKVINSTGLSFNATLEDKGESGILKELDFTPGQANAFEFTKDEAKSIFTTYPFLPKIQAQIGTGEVTVTRNAKFGLTGSIKLETDGTVELWNSKD